MKNLAYELDVHSKSIWQFASATAMAKANFVYLQEAGHFYAQKRYYTARTNLDSFLIKFTVSGGGILEYGNCTEKVGKGHFFWIDCMERQHYYTDPKHGHWEVIWVHFNGKGVRAYYNAFRNLQSGAQIRKLPAGSPMHNLLETLLNRIPLSKERVFSDQNLLEADIQISGLLTQLMVACILTHEDGDAPSNMPPVVREIRSFLANNIGHKISLQFLAEKFNLDSFYLQKLFKKHIGQSPTQYLIYQRMAQAKMLLRTTNKSVSEIAYAVGIENISYFTRQFRKLEGVTPYKYRNIWTLL